MKKILLIMICASTICFGFEKDEIQDIVERQYYIKFREHLENYSNNIEITNNFQYETGYLDALIFVIELFYE